MLLLLKAFASDQVDKDCLNDYTPICIEDQEMYPGLMIAGSQGDKDRSLNVIFLDKAGKAKKAFFDIIYT
jgi:hypothetical protein